VLHWLTSGYPWIDWDKYSAEQPSSQQESAYSSQMGKEQVFHLAMPHSGRGYYTAGKWRLPTGERCKKNESKGETVARPN